MQMIRLALCLLLVFSGAVIGLSCARRLRQRCETLLSFQNLFRKAALKTTYHGGDLCEVFRDNFAGHTFRYGEPFDAQWKELVARFQHTLSKEDRSLLVQFAEDFGAADPQSQRRRLELYVRLLEEQLHQAKEAAEKKSKLYRVLPLSAGTVLALLLI